MRRSLTALLALSIVLVSLSIFLPVTVHNRTELQQIKLGFPIHFIVQSQIGLPFGFPDAPPFPVCQAVLSPWEYALQVIWWGFFLDIAIIFSALNLVSPAVRFLRRRAQS